MQTKKLNIVLLLSMVFIAASAFVAYAGMDLETEAPVSGISIALNHYYARTLEPEKGLKESIELVASDTIVLTEERVQKVQKVTQKLIEEATPEEREIVTENAVTWGTVVGTNNLRLRSGPSSEARTLTLLGEGDHYVVIGQEGDFLKVQVDDDLEGYVFKDYIDTSIKYDNEKLTPEEEAARKAETARLKKEAEEAMKALEEARKAEQESKEEKKKDEKKKEETTSAIKGTDAPTKSSGEEKVAPPTAAGGQVGEAPEGGEELVAPTPEYGTLHEGTEPQETEEETEKETTKAPETTAAKETKSSGPDVSGGPGSVTSATRTAMVAYAKQFLGNPYVYGGTDMYNGTDCSGFTMNIYAHFGYNIGRTSRDQAAKGTEISQSEAQPGDLFFYDKDGYINHVTMYIGNGQVIHASSPTNGIIISSANYRTPCKCCRFIK